MKTIIRNFISVLRRYKLAAILNVLGLTIAFAAFMVIMMQVDYDRNFDRFHKDADRIYRMDLCMEDGNKWAIISRPFSDAVIQSSPHILAGTICNPFIDKLFFSVENNGNRNSYQESSLEVTPSFTDVFTFDMLAGTDKALDDPEKALIPQSLSQKLFGGETAVGKQLVTGYKNYTVGGVYKDFPPNSSIQNVIYTPLDPKVNLTNWDNWNYSFFVRVDAPENVAGLFENFKKNFDGEILKKAFGEEFSWDGGPTCQFTALPELHFITDVQYDSTPKASRQTMLILLAIAFVIVAIAGINFTNFSTALTPKRIRSINIQKVLGGETWVIRTSLVMEGIVISFCSCLLALGMIYVAKDTPLASLVDADLSVTAHLGLIFATGGLAILTGLLAGLYPAFYTTSFQPALALKGSFGLSARGRRLRNLLIGIQFVASFALIIGASFMYLQNYYMQHTPLGYDKEELIVAEITSKVFVSRDAFTNQLKNFSGIEDVTYGKDLISSGDQYMSWGRGYHDKNIQFQCLVVDPSFLKVMGIEIKEGRNFRPEDEKTRQGVYIFNEKARNQYNMVLNDRIDSAEIVGFMPDVKFASFRTEVVPMAFFVQGTWYEMQLSNAYVKVKAGSDLRAAMAHVRSSLKSIDDEYPFNVRFFDEVINASYDKEQKLSSLITLFSLVAIFISIVGVFGLVVFDSEYRRKEISIRKVFGSTTTEILVAFNKSYVRILGICFVPAASLAWYAVDHWLENFAYKTAMYWWVYVVAFAIVFILTVATVTFQNWRAANANPINSIKTE